MSFRNLSPFSPVTMVLGDIVSEVLPSPKTLQFSNCVRADTLNISMDWSLGISLLKWSGTYIFKSFTRLRAVSGRYQNQNLEVAGQLQIDQYISQSVFWESHSKSNKTSWRFVLIFYLAHLRVSVLAGAICLFCVLSDTV